MEPTIKPTIEPTIKPSMEPTIKPTIKPTINPTINPTIKPTIKPSIKPTIQPPLPQPTITNECQVLIPPPVFVFDTKIAFSSINSTEIDNDSQKAVVLATANAMLISTIFVKYIETAVETRRRLFAIMTISLQTSIPLQGYYQSYQVNPGQLYETLTTNLANSVNTGAFKNALPPIFANSTLTSIENSNYIIIHPPTETQVETKEKIDLSIIYIVIFLLGLLIMVKLAYDFPKIKKRCTESEDTDRI
jgi:hypothetical protein